jgi:hypothetical protein
MKLCVLENMVGLASNASAHESIGPRVKYLDIE